MLEEHKKEIIDLYVKQNISSITIAKKFGVCTSSICRFLKKNNIEIRDPSHSKRKYKINENIFETIDTPEKAYWLGLLYADGCHLPKKNEIRISLQEIDKEILDKLKEFLGYSGNLIFLNFKSKYPKWQNQYKLQITNKKISSDLLKHGFISDKTYKLEFPLFLEEYLQSHFIRGFFDGDGSIYLSPFKKDYVRTGRFNIVAPINFLDKIQEIFIKNFNFKKNKYQYITNRNEFVKILCYSGNFKLSIIRDYLYKDSTIFLKRKKDKFDLIKTYRQKRNEFYLDKNNI
ncbi:MAG: hypothetical protein WC554_12700 [Clostridia bacterium]